MNKVLWVLVVMLVAAAGVVSACGGATPTPAEQPDDSQPTATIEEEPTAASAPADGETLLQDHCAACHSLERVKQAQKSREEWERTVARMVGKGTDVNKDEQAVLIEYLAETYGP